MHTLQSAHPRSPCGERQNRPVLPCMSIVFLSTLSLRRATLKLCQFEIVIMISIHALLAESDVKCCLHVHTPPIFLSTLSLRRATIVGPVTIVADTHFYPRSPCGERQVKIPRRRARRKHFYPRSPCGERLTVAAHVGRRKLISIHALLAESD